jgi:E3 ubiquitin-protein ligase BAH
MKFAHDFGEALEKGEYPPLWVESAISYRQLKKCVKKVQQELSALGLDADTLHGLWQDVSSNDSRASAGSKNGTGDHFRYTFAGQYSICRGLD